MALGELVGDALGEARAGDKGLVDTGALVAERLAGAMVVDPLKQAAAEVKTAAYSDDPVTAAENLDDAAQKVGGVVALAEGARAAGTGAAKAMAGRAAPKPSVGASGGASGAQAGEGVRTSHPIPPLGRSHARTAGSIPRRCWKHVAQRPA